ITRSNRTPKAFGVGFDRKLDVVLRELDSINRSLFVDFRAGFGGMIQQHLIKITAGYLIRMIGLRTIAVLEIKLRSGFRTRAEDFAAELLHEPGTQEFFMQPQPGKRFHAERQERFADVKTRKLFAFEDNHAAASAC